MKGAATAITLVTAPPEGGIYYSQVYLIWSSEDTGYGSHRPSPPTLDGGAINDGDGPVLGPNEIISHWVRSHLHHRNDNSSNVLNDVWSMANTQPGALTNRVSEAVGI